MKLDTHSRKGIMIGYSGGTNQYKVWDLTRDDVMVTRDMVFIEGKPINEAPAVYETSVVNEVPAVHEEARTIYESITVLPGPPADAEE